MSDAIGVLKRIIRESKQEFEKTTIAEIDIFEKELPILKEALLALEQKEKATVCFDKKNMGEYSKYCEKQGALEELKRMYESISVFHAEDCIDLKLIEKRIKELEEGVE